ncbi:pyridoxal phosphate-dependent aminotransferase [Calditrichota bacterium]
MFNWIKRLDGDYIDLSSSGILGPTTLSELDLDPTIAEIGGNNFYGYHPSLSAIGQLFNVSKDSIVITSGASMANYLAMTAMMGKGDPCIIETPVYEPLLSVVRHVTQAEPVRIFREADSGYSLNNNPEIFLRHKPKLTVLTNPHNPTGYVDPLEVFLEIAEIVSEWDGWLLIDEVFLPFISRFRELSLAGKHPNILVTGSLTKVWGLGGLRYGWLIGDANVMRQIELNLDYMSVNQPFIVEWIGSRLLESPHSDRLLIHARERAAQNLKIVEEFARSFNFLDFYKPSCGISALFRFKDGKDSYHFCSLLHDRYNTIVVPGRYFEVDDGFRLSFGCEQSKLLAGLQNIENALTSNLG